MSRRKKEIYYRQNPAQRGSNLYDKARREAEICKSLFPVPRMGSLIRACLLGVQHGVLLLALRWLVRDLRGLGCRLAYT